MEKLLPTITMGINFVAALVYVYQGDFPRFVYWVCAGLLTCSVTWWMK